jgi:hypothetical protein
VADLPSPIDGQARDDLAACFQMLWRRAILELSDADRVQFERLCCMHSLNFIADRTGYYAFITYTLFFGLVPSGLK